MKILRIFFSIALWLMMPIVSFGIDFELSDVIKEAREKQMQIADKEQIKNNVEQIKQQYKNQNEQSACEKINQNEILGK